MTIPKRTIPGFALTHTTTITVKRPGEVTYVNGRKQVGLPTTHTIEANIQPFKYKDLMLLPEADRTKQWYKLFMTPDQDIREATEGDNPVEADSIVWHGLEYKVMQIQHWEMGVLDHTVVRVARTPISGGV